MNAEVIKPPESDKENKRIPLPMRLWDRVTAPSPRLTDIGEIRAARLASSFLILIAFLNLIGILARASRLGLVSSFSGPIGYSFATTLLVYPLSRTKWYRAAVFLFAFSFSALAYLSIFIEGNGADFGAIVLIYVPLSLIVASSFVSAPAVFLLVGLNIGAYLSLQKFGISLPDNIGGQAGIITVMGVVLMLLTNFRNTTEKIRIEELQKINNELGILSKDLEQRVENRTAELEKSSAQIKSRAAQLELIAEVANSIATLQNIDQLLPYITKIVSERFGFYHAGIFLLSEDKKYAVLRAANSEGGQKMLARKHQLRVGEEGIVGISVEQKHARIALDVGEDAVYFNNPDLPATRSELALPLLIGGDVIGVLDVQSEEPNAFSDEDIEVLNTLANQVAVAIENARLFQQAREALEELDNTFQRYVSSEWRQFSAKSAIIGYRAHSEGINPITTTTKNASDNNSNGKQRIPIKLRGTTLGSLDIDMGDHAQVYTEEERNLVQTVADRLAIALESARLLEESQKAAAKEQIIGEITGKIGSSINLRNVLQTAVEELGHAIPGSEIVIQLKPEQRSEERQQ